MQRDFATLSPCAAEGARGDLRVTPRAEDGKNHYGQIHGDWSGREAGQGFSRVRQTVTTGPDERHYAALRVLTTRRRTGVGFATTVSHPTLRLE